ncbi:MAG TPA: hypothetical protein VF365_09165 [Candidatus Limnocylindria bacterium]
MRVKRLGFARWIGRPVNVPLSHVSSIAKAEPAEARRWSIGIRVAGIHIPGVITSGLFRQDGRLAWWDVRRGREVLVITLRDERIAKLVIEVDDPAAVTLALARATAGPDT